MELRGCLFFPMSASFQPPSTPTLQKKGVVPFFGVLT